jgi:glycosyltransferase involved in cell wall biosynthesis
MRILRIHNRYRSGAPGGEDAVFDAETRLLESAGHELIRYERSNDEMREDSLVDGLRTVAGLLGSTQTRRELAELIARHRPEIAHIHNTFPLVSASAHQACRQAGVPIVQTVHNYRFSCAAGTHFREGRVCEDCDAASAIAAIRHRCYRGSQAGSIAVAAMIRHQRRSVFMGDGVARFIALSRFAAERLAAFGVDRTRIVTRPNFVDDLPPRYSGPRGYAVFAGRLSAEKGVWTLLEAWRQVPDLPLKIIGEGPQRAALQRRAQELAIRVEFLGMRTRAETLQVVREALMQIVPSEWFEGMPLVVLEAWGLGVPVVMSRVGSLTEMAGDNLRGLLFEPGDADQLATQVLRLQALPALREALTAAAHTRFVAEHTRERALETLLATYRAAAGEAGQPSRIG